MQEYFQPSKKRVLVYLRVLYLIWIFTGMFSLMYVSETLIAEDNPAETAQNLLDNELLFRLGVAGALVTQVIQIIVLVLFTRLFRGVNSTQLKLLAVFGFLGIPIAMLAVAPQLAAFNLAESGNHELMITMLDLNEFGVLVASIFWGLWLFPLGSLVQESKYFPRILGYFLYIGGIGYLVGTFVEIISPGASAILSVTEFLTFGEVLFLLWLIIMGAKYE